MSDEPPRIPFIPDRARFDGLLLSFLVFGALLMLFVQLVQVLLHRPSRDTTFWCIVSYSSFLFTFVLAAILGRFRDAEALYVIPVSSISLLWCQFLLQISAIIIPCFADIIMFYRLVVLYTQNWKILILPAALYLVRIGLSVPFIISGTKASNLHNPNFDYNYTIALASVFVALNLTFTALVYFRLFTMRRKAERVLGRVPAMFYTSFPTLFVESGTLFTLWSIVYLILRSTGNWVKDVFFQTYVYILILTRMLMVMRIAQHRAWTADLVLAAEDGMLDWSISSSISIDLPHHNHSCSNASVRT